MDENLRAQIETYLAHLNALIHRGFSLRDTLQKNPADKTAIAATRAWQEDCGVTVNQLSGGGKAHWLARSFSEAFLMRSENGNAAVGAAPDEIVRRLTEVLEQAIVSLTGMGDGAIVAASTQAPAPHRFDFVHNVELRPVLEQAYTDSRRAQEEGDFEFALRTSCGILEAIVTDALEYEGIHTLTESDIPEGNISDWPFETRLALAEHAGLIRGGCARLPAAARSYRDGHESGEADVSTASISESDARRTGQVLHVVMRDLDPGR